MLCYTIFQGYILGGLKGSQWTALLNYLTLVMAIDCFGQSMVVKVADHANGRLDALQPTVRSIWSRHIGCPGHGGDQPAVIASCATMISLLDSVQNGAGMRDPDSPSAHKQQVTDVDHEREIAQTLPRCRQAYNRVVASHGSGG
jgi:hypothetical protein